MQEIWRDISGYEGLYQVSNLGNVKSLKFGKERIMKYTINRGGYYHLELSSKGKCKQYNVHRLVALAFIPNPDNKECVDHINGVRLDNRVENLRWCTKEENANFPLAKQNKSISMTNHPKKSQPVLQIDKNTGEIINEYPSTCEAARQLGVSDSPISKCARGVHYNSAYGYIWKYK